jgi:hypothetical protein
MTVSAMLRTTVALAMSSVVIEAAVSDVSLFADARDLADADGSALSGAAVVVPVGVAS